MLQYGTGISRPKALISSVVTRYISGEAGVQLCIVAALMVTITITIQSWRGAWVWLIIMPVIVSCTDLFLYFLYLSSNFIQLVPILFTPVQLCTFLNFLENFYMSSKTLVLSLCMHDYISFSSLHNIIWQELFWIEYCWSAPWQ